jgi:MFS family permease
MFTSLTLLPLYLAKPPYSLTPTIVGVCFLPVGVAMLIGAVFGGMISDWAAVKYPESIDGRAYPNILLTWLVPIGCIGFGYAVDKGANLGAVLIAQSVLGFGQSIHMPAILNYLSAARPDNMGAVGAVSSFLNFALAAIVVSVSVPIADAIGIANFFWILTGVTAGTLAWATWACMRNMHLGKANPELKDIRRNQSRKQRPSGNTSSKTNKSGKVSEKSAGTNGEFAASDSCVPFKPSR